MIMCMYLPNPATMNAYATKLRWTVPTWYISREVEQPENLLTLAR